nr:hypothetical protein [uncultured Ruminococcus sp.]
MADFSKYFRAYMNMQDILKNDFTYNYIMEGLKDGDKGEDRLDGKTNEKVIDMEWVVAIEETLPYIRKAIDEQRRFIKQVDNVVRVELAKKIGPESVKHLSQHTNFIAKVEGDMVTPNKILTIEREESFAIYENRVLMTLIRKALHFVDDKYSKMKDVPNDSYNDISMVRHINFNEKKVDFNLNYINESHETLADDLDVLDVTQLSDFDRIRKIRTTLNEFLNTQLMKEIANEPEVHPPLTQTNLLKKNPNFKKAVELWNFLDSYKRKGFEVVTEDYDGKMTDTVQQDVYFAMGFEHFMMSIATNPGLRVILKEQYDAENARLAEEAAKPQKTREAVMKAQLEAVRKEEMEIRLREIRDREKKILDLTSEIKNLKVIIDQKEQQILTLRGKVSALEDRLEEVKAELQQTKLKLMEAEKRIAELEEENQQLKDTIEELNKTIDELNQTIDTLNKKIVELNDRILVLVQENARLQTKIKEQEEVIAEQKAHIDELETQVAEQLAKITALKENLEKCHAQIEEDARKITDLTGKNEKLTDTLQTERIQHKETVNKMNADFAEEKHQMNDAHLAEVESLNHKFNDAEAEHNAYVAKLNADFAAKANETEQKHLKELADKEEAHRNELVEIKEANIKSSAANDAAHASELKKAYKSVDKKVEQAEKACEKRMKAKVAEIKKEAQAEIRKAEKKAGEKISLAKEEVKSIKDVGDLFVRDFGFGSVAVVSKYAEELAKFGKLSIADELMDAQKSVRSLCICRSKKGVMLAEYSRNGADVYKIYKKQADLEVAFSDLCSKLKSAGRLPLVITFSGVDRPFAMNFENIVRESTGKKTTVVHNKTLKADGFVAVYYSVE